MSARGSHSIESHLPSEGEAVGVELDGRSFVVVRVEGALLAYENRCPHKGVSLDWAPGRFLSSDGRYLQCATHGALFRPDTGACVLGPCEGASLASAPLRYEQGAWKLEENR